MNTRKAWSRLREILRSSPAYRRIRGRADRKRTRSFRELTGTRRAEDEIRQRDFRLQMQFAVTKAFAECIDVASAMDEVLVAIAGPLRCVAGFFWRTTQEGGFLQVANTWCAPGYDKLADASSRLRLRKGEGLPGLAWATHEPVWGADLSRKNFRGMGVAGEPDIAGGFALPIAVAGSFYGVVEVLAPSSLQTDAELEALLEDIARQVGLFIARVISQIEIRLSRARLSEAQRIARIGSWEWDLVANRVDVSDELLTIFCIEPGEFDGTLRGFLSLFGTEDRAMRAVLNRASERREDFEHDFKLRLRDNRIRSFHARGGVVLQGQRVSRMIGTVQDVTEQSLLKMEVERAQRLDSLGRVAASIAHEFNNTLMGISPAAEFLERAAADPATKRAAKRILQSVQRGKTITSEILRFAQLSEPVVEPVEVTAWLETAARELREIVGPVLDVHVIQPPPGRLVIAGDVQQLNQVILNLGLNSRDAAPAGGQLFLSATPANAADESELGLLHADQYVHLQVRDTGSGIDAEAVQKIFEPLFTTKRSGTGLGLAVVQQIVTQHHGHVFVVSEVGRGTTFHLFLPAAVESERMEPATLAKEIRLAHKRLLLVEDDEMVATGISVMLRLEGLEVEVVGEGKAVMDAIRRFRPDVVVLDVGLPDVPGTEVFLLIEESYPDLPVVFSTGHADPGLIARPGRRHRIGFLQKPYDTGTLLASLAAVMD